MLKLFKKQKRTQTCAIYLVDFFINSDIHGLTHLARKDIHWIEFLFWFIIIIAILCIEVFLNNLLLNIYKAKNVGIDSDLNFVNFVSTEPAFTFCPEPLLNEKQMKIFIKEHEKSNDHGKNARMENFLQQLLHTTISSRTKFPLLNYNLQPEFYMETIYNLTETQLITMNGIEGERVMTDVGICYSFNINRRVTDAIEYRRFGNIKATINQRNLTGSKEFDYYEKFPRLFKFQHNFSTSFKIFVHSTYEVPTTWSKPVAIIQPESKLKLLMDFRDITHKEDFTRFTAIENRKCRTESESDLTMFPRIYSRNLCLTNCRAQHAIKVCDCIPHYYDNDAIRVAFPLINICSPIGLNCLAKIGHILRNLQSHVSEKQYGFQCNCLPNCKDMFLIRLNYIPTFDAMNESDVEVSIDYPPDMQFQRRIYYSYTDFEVARGGMFALWCGCSLLSIYDILYYFSLRLFWFRRGYFGACYSNQ